MTVHVVLMILSLIAAGAGLLVRDKDVKLILWPAAYALMCAAAFVKSGSGITFH